MANPIAIIGAGIGGLSTAIHLAAAGRRVVVFEKNSAVGRAPLFSAISAVSTAFRVA